jgi:hypothetical protein
VPDGTVTVGCVPKVPAGDGSWTGTITDEVAAVVGVVAVDEDEESADELLHPANPKVEAVSTTSDQVRRRDIGDNPFEGGDGGTLR